MIVFANGCFDGLHEGHLRLLRRCRELADTEGRVIVGLNSDASIRRLKGSQRPLLSLEDRRSALMGCGLVDEVIVFEEDTPLELIRMLGPNVIVKGSDYMPDEVVGHGLGIRIEIVPRVPGISTTESMVQKWK